MPEPARPPKLGNYRGHGFLVGALPVHLLHTLSIEVIGYLPAGRAAQKKTGG